MLVPNRNYSSPSYRYGFNGKEKDDEVKGSGIQYDYGFRIYDPRLGKFLTEDPLRKEFPFLTPYQYASNTPIAAIDLDGLENYIVVNSPWFAGKIKQSTDKEDMRRSVELSFLSVYAKVPNNDFAKKAFNGNEMAGTYGSDNDMPEGLTVWSYNDKGALEMLFGYKNDLQKSNLSQKETKGFWDGVGEGLSKVGAFLGFKKAEIKPTKVVYSDRGGYKFWMNNAVGSRGVRIIGGSKVKSIDASFMDALSPFGGRKVPVISKTISTSNIFSKSANNLKKAKDLLNSFDKSQKAIKLSINIFYNCQHGCGQKVTLENDTIKHSGKSEKTLNTEPKNELPRTF